MSDWTLDLEDTTYGPLPASWLDHPDAVDRGPADVVRYYAVSVGALGGRTLRIRYLSPARNRVVVAQCGAGEHDKGGLVPSALLKGLSWPRSLPRDEFSKTDVRYGVEREHFEAIWSDRDDIDLPEGYRDPPDIHPCDSEVVHHA